MSKPKINTRDLVNKIERLTRERMTKESVVSLGDFRGLTKKHEAKTILVVEDDETMRGALKRLFEGEGYRVKLASDGTQLSSVFDDSPIDLIILDIGLPWVNGFELAGMLKEHEDLKYIPLVFISGNTSELDIKRGFDVGADDYITKPFDIEKMKKTVSSLLKLNK